MWSAGEFPVVLGGDCSIVLGGLLALRRALRLGLLFIDGQADFNQPEAEPKGEAASMDLQLGAERAALQALDHLTRAGGPERFWIHVDADVLDDAIMPAVDYRMPGGLDWSELEVSLRRPWRNLQPQASSSVSTTRRSTRYAPALGNSRGCS